jgi:hypothetical protein
VDRAAELCDGVVDEDGVGLDEESHVTVGEPGRAEPIGPSATGAPGYRVILGREMDGNGHRAASGR